MILGAADPLIYGPLLALTGAVIVAIIQMFSSRRAATIAVLPQKDRNDIDKMNLLYEQQQRIVDNLQAEIDRKETQRAMLEDQAAKLQEALDTCIRGRVKMEQEIQKLNRQAVTARHRIERLKKGDTP